MLLGDGVVNVRDHAIGFAAKPAEATEAVMNVFARVMGVPLEVWREKGAAVLSRETSRAAVERLFKPPEETKIGNTSAPYAKLEFPSGGEAELFAASLKAVGIYAEVAGNTVRLDSDSFFACWPRQTPCRRASHCCTAPMKTTSASTPALRKAACASTSP